MLDICPILFHKPSPGTQVPKAGDGGKGFINTPILQMRKPKSQRRAPAVTGTGAGHCQDSPLEERFQRKMPRRDEFESASANFYL